jgi:hypothetical protein
VVAPKGLVARWVAELRLHFHKELRPVAPAELAGFRQLAPELNPWRVFPQVVCAMDSVKPFERRRGWSAEYVAAYNRVRFEDLLAAGWDLVIIDEAHRLGGATEQVARYQLGEALAAAAPYLLLLSATPHQGKRDAFRRLIGLLDPAAFPPAVPLTRERVQPYVIRTGKRQAIDERGAPLFRPRQTQLVPVAWPAAGPSADQRRLYEAVADYVREGYKQALREKKPYIGFLMVLMQRLFTSSTRAVRVALDRRLEALGKPD